MMKNLQKMGGIAALYGAATWLVLIGFLIFLVDPTVVDPVQQVALQVDNQAIRYMWNLIMYVGLGISLVVLALALYERLKAGSPAMVQIATAIGLIWACLLIGAGMVSTSGLETVVDLYGKDPAQAATVWLTIESVVQGLGREIGSLWVLLVSWAALRAGGLPKALNYLGVVIGVAGILTFVPALYDMAVVVYGLGLMVWFIWLGIVMLRSSPSAAA
jgi:hypothetical protein